MSNLLVGWQYQSRINEQTSFGTRSDGKTENVILPEESANDREKKPIDNEYSCGSDSTANGDNKIIAPTTPSLIPVSPPLTTPSYSFVSASSSSPSSAPSLLSAVLSPPIHPALQLQFPVDLQTAAVLERSQTAPLSGVATITEVVAIATSSTTKDAAGTRGDSDDDHAGELESLMSACATQATEEEEGALERAALEAKRSLRAAQAAMQAAEAFAEQVATRKARLCHTKSMMIELQKEEQADSECATLECQHRNALSELTQQIQMRQEALTDLTTKRAATKKRRNVLVKWLRASTQEAALSSTLPPVSVAASPLPTSTTGANLY